MVFEDFHRKCEKDVKTLLSMTAIRDIPLDSIRGSNKLIN
mgnify:CR=1 FL=1